MLQLMIIEQRYALKDSSGSTLAKIVGLSDYQPSKSGAVREWKVTYNAAEGDDTQEDIFYSFAQMETSLSERFFAGSVETFEKLLEQVA
jgi:hypothetical protein